MAAATLPEAVPVPPFTLKLPFEDAHTLAPTAFAALAEELDFQGNLSK